MQETMKEVQHKPNLSEFISAHNQYRLLIMEYEITSIAYKANPSHDNWLMLQAIRELKRQEKVIEVNRMMVMGESCGQRSDDSIYQALALDKV